MNTQMEEQWLSCVEADWDKAEASAREIAKGIDEAGLNPSGVLPTEVLYIPKLFSQKDKVTFEHIVQTMMGIFRKSIEAYRKDPEVQALFPFDDRLKELIMLDPPYSNPIPVCRIDIFYNEETGAFKFCEFNTDGTSTMFDNMVINSMLERNAAWKDMGEPGYTMELVDKWIDEFLKNAQEAGNAHPSIAITDFLENAWLPDLMGFARRMQQRGLDAEVVDIRDFAHENGKLINKKTGKVYDAVYRRAVTGDIMERYDEVLPFIEAVKAGDVILEGMFLTDIPHHKAIATALYHPALRKYFTQEECAFIDAHQPRTVILSEEEIPNLLEKDKWILKPTDSYGSKGVVCGRDVTQQQWEQALNDVKDEAFVVQEFVTPFKTKNVEPDKDHKIHKYSNQTGLYTYNGKFAGVYSRLAEGNVISSEYNRKIAPTVFEKA